MAVKIAVYFMDFLHFDDWQVNLSVCGLKVPLHLSDDMKHFPKGLTLLATDLSSEEASPPPVPSAVSKQNASDLSVLLDALDRNLAEQGVIMQPKGLCAACVKPIVGRVSNFEVEYVYSFL